jgi:hypothetical protein
MLIIVKFSYYSKHALRMSSAKICKKILESSKLATEKCYGVIFSFGRRWGTVACLLVFYEI